MSVRQHDNVLRLSIDRKDATKRLLEGRFEPGPASGGDSIDHVIHRISVRSYLNRHRPLESVSEGKQPDHVVTSKILHDLASGEPSQLHLFAVHGGRFLQ